MNLRVQLFGEFRVWKKEQELTSLLTHLGKPKALFKILLTHPGRIFSPDELIEWLWPDLPQPAATSNLRKRISELRHALEPKLARGSDSQYILTRSSGYSFNEKSDYCTDAQVFLEKFEVGQKFEQTGNLSAAISAYESAAELAQGEFLAEDRYEDWAIALRDQWQELHLKVLERLAESYARLGQYDRASEQCQHILQMAPTRESAYRQAMLSLYLQGNSSEALEVYQRCCRVLRDQLDVAPSSDTQEIYQRILQHDVIAPPRAIPHNLPLALANFIGREREMVQIKWQLATTRLLTLVGPGGCGKSRLALEVAWQVLKEYPDGVWLVELASLSDQGLILPHLATTLGLQEKDRRSSLETLKTELRTKNLLLVLDNCEHMVSACAQLAEALLSICPHVQILATSRQDLGLLGETCFPVPSLTVPQSQPLSPIKILQQYEAVNLFVERALASQPRFSLTSENAAAVVEICQQLDGMPLAIELAAARVKALSVNQIAERLRDRFQLLNSERPMSRPHQQTLQATMDWSWELLSEAERILLRRLSVFTGGFTLEALEAVCADRQDDAPLPIADILHRLSHLVDKSLVLVEAQGKEARYRLLETMRHYAEEKLHAAGELEELRKRHLLFFVHGAEKAFEALDETEEAKWFARFDLEHDNLRAALSWALETGRIEKALRLSKTLWVFWYSRGYFGEGRTWLKKILGQSQSLHTELYARVLNGAGRLACEQGDYTEARQRHQATLSIYQELSDKRGIASQYINLGVIESYQRNHAAARAFYEQALPLFRELGNKVGMAHALANLGSAAHEQGDYEASRAYHQESLVLYQELGEKGNIASAWDALGLVAHSQGKYEDAAGFYKEALILYQTIGHRHGVAATLGYLASVAHVQGDHQLACSRYEESLAIHRETGDKKSIAYSLRSLGSVSRSQGKLDQAIALYEESLALFRQLEIQGGIASVLCGLAGVAYHEKQYRRATDLYQESLVLYRKIEEKPGILESLYGLAEIACAQEEFVRAARLFAATEALREAMSQGYSSAERAEYEAHLTKARRELGEDAFVAAWAHGRAMTLEQVIEYALNET